MGHCAGAGEKGCLRRGPSGEFREQPELEATVQPGQGTPREEWPGERMWSWGQESCSLQGSLVQLQ